MRGAHGGGGRGGGGKREKKPIPEEGPYRSFVGNLPHDMVQGEFDQIFQGLSINSIHMMRDRETDVFKGFAYVEFGNREDLEKALDLDGVEFDKKIVRIDVAEDRRKDRPNKFGPSTRGGRGGDRGGNSGHHHRGGREFVRSDRQEGRGGSSHQRRQSPKTDQSGFQKVERGGFRGNRARGDMPHNSRGNGNGNRRGGHEGAAPPVRMAAEPDPERPKLNLKPRTTDPEELERRRVQEEEERKKRQEKICTAKRDDE
uniref:RRM domain-containing protein n=1 Tax=Panagrolaimus superbus TaxID=310955 RepID=A0A914YT49_9BILA